MTNLGDLLGNMADKLAQDNLNVGDVHFFVHPSCLYTFVAETSMAVLISAPTEHDSYGGQNTMWK